MDEEVTKLYVRAAQYLKFVSSFPKVLALDAEAQQDAASICQRFDSIIATAKDSPQVAQELLSRWVTVLSAQRPSPRV